MSPGTSIVFRGSRVTTLCPVRCDCRAGHLCVYVGGHRHSAHPLPYRRMAT